jgi:hypothetical protein
MMKRISFRDSIASKLLLAIIAFPALLTLSGFFVGCGSFETTPMATV